MVLCLLLWEKGKRHRFPEIGAHCKPQRLFSREELVCSPPCFRGTPVDADRAPCRVAPDQFPCVCFYFRPHTWAGTGFGD